jgi:hypothetical protein
VLAMIQSLWLLLLTIADEPESAVLAIGLCVVLSVSSLVSPLYLPAARWIACKVATTPN